MHGKDVHILFIEWTNPHLGGYTVHMLIPIFLQHLVISSLPMLSPRSPRCCCNLCSPEKWMNLSKATFLNTYITALALPGGTSTSYCRFLSLVMCIFSHHFFRGRYEYSNNQPNGERRGNPFIRPSAFQLFQFRVSVRDSTFGPPSPPSQRAVTYTPGTSNATIPQYKKSSFTQTPKNFFILQIPLTPLL